MPILVPGSSSWITLHSNPPLHMPFKVRSLLPAAGGGRSVAEEWWRGEYWLQDDKRVRGIHPTVQSLPDLDSSWLYSQFLCHSALHSLWTITATAGFTAYRSLFFLHITWDYAAFQQFWHSDLLLSILIHSMLPRNIQRCLPTTCHHLFSLYHPLPPLSFSSSLFLCMAPLMHL